MGGGEGGWDGDEGLSLSHGDLMHIIYNIDIICVCVCVCVCVCERERGEGETKTDTDREDRQTDRD